MKIRRPFRLALGIVFAYVVAYITYSFWEYRHAEQAYQSERTSGLAAIPSEVGFNLRSMWAQQPGLLSGIGRLIVPSSKQAVPAAAPPASIMPALHSDQAMNTEAFGLIEDNPFISVAVDPRSTFSTDVDTAAYAQIRRFINQGVAPPKDAVRIEEMINYFTYDDPSPSGFNAIAVSTEVASAPWQSDHRLVRIAIKARDIDMSRRPAANLVFLIDVSGSMDDPAKLPLLKSAMKLLVDNLRQDDRVAIVVYAGSEGLALPSTGGSQKATLLEAIDALTPNGSTNGGAGIKLAYELAAMNFIKGGINRVILATDGDFNVGVTSEGDLVRLIQDETKTGVFLSVLGFGTGNIKDSMLEKLADKGNGNYAYIDTLNEARKVLIEQAGGTLVTVAKDVKVQIEFNPAEVQAHRLIGYENRILRHQEFNDDTKDAGDMGAGHCVTALFEIIPPSASPAHSSTVDALKYQSVKTNAMGFVGELMTVKVRYKDPDGEASQLLETTVVDRHSTFAGASADFRFVAAAASFGMILRNSTYKGNSTINAVIDIAEHSRGSDKNGYRDEFVRLVRNAAGFVTK